MNKSRVNIALIGLGGITQAVHLPIVQRLHDLIQITAIVDLSKKRLDDIQSTTAAGAKQFTSVDALIEAKKGGLQVDGALLATNGTHAWDAEKLVRAGIKVLSEKPFGYSLIEHTDMEQAAAETGRPAGDMIRVGYMKEYDPATRAAKEALQGKKIRSIRVEVLHPADEAQLSFANLRARATDIDVSHLQESTVKTEQSLATALGGTDGALPPNMLRTYRSVVLGSIVHDIALLRFLVGGIGTVKQASHFGDEFPGSLFLRGQLQDYDAPWYIDWHFVPEYPEYRETISILHETGTVQLTFAVPYLLNVATALETVSSLPNLGVQVTRNTWPQMEAFEEEWRNFVALIQGKSNTVGSSVQESRKDIIVGQKMIHALYSQTARDIKLELSCQ